MNTREEGVLQEGALDIVRVLSKAGHRALWAGGCVRDLLLKISPQDYDISSDADPQASIAECAPFVDFRK